MEKPLVSVVMPNYNGEEYIKQSLDSVLSQNYKNIQFIVVDDGSTDHSREILADYQDSRLEVYYLDKNEHICYALNYGLEKVKGKYIARIDSDDIWKKDKLEKQVAFMENNEAYGACFTWVDVIDDKGINVNEKEKLVIDTFERENRSQKEWLHYFLNYGNCLNHPSVVIRKTMLDKVGNYNLAFVQAQDFELWIRIVAQAPIHIIKERLVDYRWEHSSDNKVSYNNDENNTRFFNEFMLIRNNFFIYMSNEQFVQFFSDEFMNKESATDLELECEKAFILRNLRIGPDLREFPLLGLIRLERLLQNKTARLILKEKFNYSHKDFYSDNKVHIYHDPYLKDIYIKKYDQLVIEYEKCKNELEVSNNDNNAIRKEAEQLKGELEKKRIELQNHIDTIQILTNSTSWKITAPIRRAGEIIKKLKK